MQIETTKYGVCALGAMIMATALLACSDSQPVNLAPDAAADASCEGEPCGCPAEGEVYCDGECRDLSYFATAAACGGCGNVCPEGESCVNGACECTDESALCGGVCQEPEAFADDVENCGACGEACPAVPGAAPTCSDSVCGFTCDEDRGDCNEEAEDGCESDLTIDLANCGTCGNACDVPANATATCEASTCGYECSPGWKACDGESGCGCMDCSVAATITGITGARNMSWTDYDLDGDLDVAIGSSGSATVFATQGSALVNAWTATVPGICSKVAWGHMDGGGFPDLAVGHCDHGVAHVFEGTAAQLSTTPDWSAPGAEWTTDVLWTDWDADGDLDLLLLNLANLGPASRIYENVGGQLSATHVWEDPEDLRARCADWGDMDGDGDLDLAIVSSAKVNDSGEGGVHVFENAAGMLSRVWSDVSQPTTVDGRGCPRWVDGDGDGDLDLFHATQDGESRLYEFESGAPTGEILWRAPSATDAAWIDLDGDGDLDVALATLGGPSLVFRNDGGEFVEIWSSPTSDSIRVEWRDWNLDSKPDLVILDETQLTVYTCP